jgi:RNA polymerase sigma factor (sigma-70 family)
MLSHHVPCSRQLTSRRTAKNNPSNLSHLHKRQMCFSELPKNDLASVELLARVPGAGRAFIARHDASVRKAVLRASPAAAWLVDDLTHDVYVHLWRNDFRVLRQWQHHHPLQAYLRTVVTRLVWDRLSRLQPAWEVLGNDSRSAAGSGTEPFDPAPTPEEEVAANEIGWIVRDALRRLDTRHCRVLELRFVSDLSYREIAEVLGITSTNAGVRINRALARLKASLPQLVDATDCFAIPGPGARL